jgi:streptomycin 6-kinase
VTAGHHPLTLPRNLAEAAKQDGREAWLDTLPITIAGLTEQWSLTVGAPFSPGGQTAWVAPVRDAAGHEMVMKVGWRHPEALHEAEGLRAWSGHGAVRLYASEELDDTVGLLLEACRPGTALAARPEVEQDLVVTDLLRRLWSVPTPGDPFRSLQIMCDQWADESETKVAGGGSGIDPGLAREGLRLFRSLPATADREVLLCTDLHAENVLAAEREPWLMIDPKPYVGDPTYDPLQHMLNCEERLRADPRGLATRLADLLDLDRDRLVLWLFARCVQESPGWPLVADVARQLDPR